MKLMALGEVGAFLLGIVSVVMVNMLLDDVSTFSRVFISSITLYFATKIALGFVHLGYIPNGEKQKR